MKFQMPGGAAAAASRSRQVPGAAVSATGPASSRALGSQVSTTAAAAGTAARTSATSAGTQASLLVVSHRQLGPTRRLVQRRWPRLGLLQVVSRPRRSSLSASEAVWSGRLSK